jgi:hypothetical protein
MLNQKIFLPLLIGAFLLALGRFVYFRFSSGESYPQYSTLRADPLGSKALLESIGRIDGITVERNFEAIERILPQEHSTLIFLAMPRFGSTGDDFEKIGHLARAGERVVLAFDIPNRFSPGGSTENSQKKEAAEKGKKAEEPEAIESSSKQAGFTFKPLEPLRLNTNQLVAARDALPETGLPDILPWRGHFWINPSSGEWETVYSVKEKPVVVEKKTGLGSIVILADSFLFSNEALLKERHADFLLWTFGGASRIVFDETHLGLHAGSGISVVLREYRLHGLFGGLLLLGILWIWKNSSTFVPAWDEAQEGDGSIAGKTVREGMLHLLERNIPVERLPAVCLEEWAKSQGSAGLAIQARVQRAQQLLAEQQPKTKNGVIELYQKLSATLSTKRIE